MPDSPRRRSRSRSPPRRPKASGGFKWKDKRSAQSDDPRDNGRDNRGLQRGYRDRSPKRDRERDRDRDYGRDRNSRDRSPRRDRSRDRDREREPDRYRDENRDRDRYRRDRSPRDNNSNRPTNRERDRDAKPKPKKDKPPAAATTNPGEEMIIVTVNDRLGTKAQIPAFPSDTVGQFKIMVAMKVGREPHEILLKRQGERPFKDAITLGDYGISNGVQLDLEVDTGD
ncbi:ubiquitin-related domain-containing protein [Corynascus similis CBS 632.67]